MDTTEDQITNIINETNELIPLNYLFQLYNQLNLDELIELKYKNQENQNLNIYMTQKIKKIGIKNQNHGIQKE